jgi:glycerol kinase
VLPTSGRFGTTADDAACGAGIPISGIAGDQQSALFGQMCVRPGMAKNTYGTGAFTLANVGTDCPEPVDGLLSTVAWTLPASVLGEGGSELITHYALEGAIYVAGAAVQWLRDGLQIIDEAPAVEALARQCEDTDGVFVVPAFTGLGSPWWDPYARGTVVGITRGTGRPQIARATLESIAFQTRDVIDSMATAGGHAIDELRVDGGAAADELLLQLQADQLGIPVVRPVVTETTALGAAYLAGLAEGVWGSVADIEHRWQVDLRTEPQAPKDEADARHQQWLRAVERSRAWAHAAP